MKYKAVIFDLDGVIVSTDQLHYRAWKKMADMEGIYFDQEINHQLRGVSRADSLEIILKKATKKYTQEEKLKLMTFKNDIYVKSLSELTPEDILPNINYVLDELINKNIKIAIGSSSRNAGLIFWSLQIDIMNPNLREYASSGDSSSMNNAGKSILVGFVMTMIFTTLVIIILVAGGNPFWKWVKIIGIALAFMLARAYLFNSYLKNIFPEIEF